MYFKIFKIKVYKNIKMWIKLNLNNKVIFTNFIFF